MLGIGVFLSLVCLAIGMPEKCSDPPLSVKYDGTYEVSCGAPLEIADTEKQPIVTWNEVSQDAGYTLMMVDPDAPSPDNPTLADYRHWLVVNIRVASYTAVIR
jgi:phosphatidylethanolamine-binding protein (PEBP) family uncharacterized protein